MDVRGQQHEDRSKQDAPEAAPREDSEKVRQLEEALQQVREQLREVREECEASNEELQSANEELHRSEERYRLLVESAEEYAIFMMDREGCITTWSAGAARILGYSKEEAVGQPGAIIFTEEDRAANVPAQEMGTAKQEGRASDERWHVRKDGERFWGSGIMTSLYRPGGELRGFAKVMRDNTERKEAEDQLRQLNETLEERVEERTRQVRELASTLTMAEQEERRRISQVLHDNLQQQLYGIQIKMAYVRRNAEGGERGELAESAEEAYGWLEEAIGMTRELTVDLSPPVLEDEGLTDILQWLTTQMEEKHGLTVGLEAAHAFRIPSEDMRTLLFQIVRELLFNVVKHAGTKRAVVKLRDADGHISIAVSDEGQGFDVEAAEAREEGGFGLFSVRERLGLFGGYMDIASAPGEGTSVTVCVPTPPDEPFRA